MKTLDQYVASEKARIDRFAAWWRDQREKEGAADWPLRMAVGEWDEQLCMFGDDNRTKSS